MAKPPRRRPAARATPKPRPVTPAPPEERVSPDDVRLVRGKGGPESGGGPGGEAWAIFHKSSRAGRIFINWIDEPPIGPHASIQIYLNRQSQGRGVGRIAYRLASEESQYDTIYAHMRKSNEASTRAAAAAGYEDVTPADLSQRLMRWVRPR
ncbi:GNAT family N-acetyltransferase [Phenylobacterium zucineum]|uniref:GNAT family N-acetyltransferase n=1 Tax=Phenylobacterium zucineum TaxID=284016 RepID=UPI0011D16580|nr:GNAT family N-acetyltransferase [Phenylobacterium zucineum]